MKKETAQVKKTRQINQAKKAHSKPFRAKVPAHVKSAENPNMKKFDTFFYRSNENHLLYYSIETNTWTAPSLATNFSRRLQKKWESRLSGGEFIHEKHVSRIQPQKHKDGTSTFNPQRFEQKLFEEGQKLSKVPSTKKGKKSWAFAFRPKVFPGCDGASVETIRAHYMVDSSIKPVTTYAASRTRLKELKEADPSRCYKAVKTVTPV